MRSLRGTGGQIYTIEGITAALILLGVLLFIIQANSIITPQTERSIDMKLYEKAGDTLTALDRSNSDSWSTIKPLKTYVEGWNGQAVAGDGIQADMAELDSNLTSMLPVNVRYSLSLIYYNSTGRHESPVIVHGIPTDNSVASTQLITINRDDPGLSTFWTTNNRFPQVVEVKITCWYL